MIKVTDDFDGLADDLLRSYDKDFEKALIETADVAVDASPVATGLFKANWHISTDEGSFEAYNEEDPDGATTKNRNKSEIQEIDFASVDSVIIQNNVKSEQEYYAETVRYDYERESANMQLDQIEAVLDSRIRS
jgi:hypothetical protein